MFVIFCFKTNIPFTFAEIKLIALNSAGVLMEVFITQSGAKINISDASCPERIVSVTGSTSQVQKAFGMIATKFEEVFHIFIVVLHCAMADILKLIVALLNVGTANVFLLYQNKAARHRLIVFSARQNLKIY